MERKIGEIFEYNGEWYQCLEEKYCNGCVFRGAKCDDVRKILGNCSVRNRSDKKSVIFKKLEKVGEPYEFQKRIIQAYKLYTTPFISVNMDFVFTYLNGSSTINIIIKQNKEDMEEKKLNLKPFDIQKAREGKTVCTRDGRKARILCFDRLCCDEISTIVACVLSKDGKDENVIIYSSDGFMADKQHPYADDLMMLPEKKEGWAKVRKDINLYDTKEEADRKMIGNDEYVTAKVCWEE